MSVTVPSGVMDGTVMVQKNATGHSSMSDAWPIDIGSGGGPTPPNLGAVTPAIGPEAGWTEVAITGSGLDGTTAVKFGGVDALSFDVMSATLIEAVTPPGTLLQSVNLDVTNPQGTGTLTSAFFYTFNPAVDITTVSPSSGDVGGGLQVTISGPSVLTVTDVKFGGVSGTGLNQINAETLRVFTPAGVAGAVDVTANGATSDVISGGFTYTNSGAFTKIEPGLAGSLGIPDFSGSGDLSGGGSGFTLLCNSAFPNAPGLLFVSLGQGSVPFKGGSIYAFPFVLTVNTAASFFGTVVLPGQIPAGTPSGIDLVLQLAFSDSGAVQNVSLSNGLKLSIP